MADQFYFGNDMQDLLLACMARYRSEFTILGPLIKPNYMWGMNAMRVCQGMQDYHEEQGLYPSLAALDGFLHEQLSRDKIDIYTEVNAYLQKLKKIDTADWKWVKEVTLKFCRERAHIVAIKKAADLVREDKVPEGGFAKMFEEVQRVGRDVSDLGICFRDDVEKIVTEATDKTWGIKTGYLFLDEIWRNGWGPGWLVVPLAPPKSYKSTFCINLALSITKKGSNPSQSLPIFYYACEISAELTALRGYSIASGLPLDSMYDDPAKFITGTRQGLGKMFGSSDSGYGQILMKTYPAKTATIADIRNHALSAIDAFGVQPRVIVIDHAETVKTSKSNKESNSSDHRSQADIYTDARALGHELKSVIIMPDRCNKDTVQKSVPDMTSFQGSFEKAGVVDIGIGLCQTDKERALGVIRYFNFINRHAKGYGYFIGKIDEDRFRMTIDDKLDYVLALEKAEEAEKERRRNFAGRGNRGGVNTRLPRELEEAA